ncbi:unnamed protein product, partial [Scytosiphon promiscuus]
RNLLPVATERNTSSPLGHRAVACLFIGATCSPFSSPKASLQGEDTKDAWETSGSRCRRHSAASRARRTSPRRCRRQRGRSVWYRRRHFRLDRCRGCGRATAPPRDRGERRRRERERCNRGSWTGRPGVSSTT